jgi:Domain of unknown function (DUF1707)
MIPSCQEVPVSQRSEVTSLVTGGWARRPDLLASDADRDAVAGLLSSALAEGRLTGAEHSERVSAAYGARTTGDLDSLTADLPGPGADAGSRHPELVPSGLDRCLLCALLVCCPPAAIAWLAAVRRRGRAGGVQGAADR